MSGLATRGNFARALGGALCVLAFVSCERSTKSSTRQGQSVPPAASASTAPTPGAELAAPPIALSPDVKTAVEPHFVEPRDIPGDILAKFAKSHDVFAFELYRKFAATQTENNFVFSPISLQLALGMLVVGARGGGENRLARVAAPGMKPERIYETMQSWQEQLLRSMNGPVQPGVERVGVLKFENSLWLDDSVQPTSNFVEKVRQYFGFGVFRAPLHSPNGGASVINQWVSVQTDSRVTQLLKTIPTTDNAVMLNGAYFKTKFASALGSTEPEPFNSKAGSKSSVDMLRTMAKIRAVQTLTYQAVELDLVYGATSLVALMPMAGSLEAFARGLTPAKWAQILVDLEHNKRTVDLHLPKSDVRSRFENLQATVGLGSEPIALPFVASSCQLTSLTQESTFVLNKDGIEVPSATGTTMQSGSSAASKDDGSLVVRFDKPYVFAVIHRLTGAIVFLGHVVAP